MFDSIIESIKEFFEEVGRIGAFAGRFFRECFSRPFEFRELIRQCYEIGYRSMPLVVITGFIMGLVLSLQIRPTMLRFGAVAYMPAMIGVAIVREIGPVITALICSGKIGSGIGAELGSMRVTEQIEAMEVSGTNPFRFLVVTRILAASLMLPILVLMADAIGIFGAFLVEHFKGEVTWRLFYNTVFTYVEFGDIIPATIKSYFFGFVIGLVGCYKGYYSTKGTAGVGRAANVAVILASLLVFLVDFVAVLVADIFFDL